MKKIILTFLSLVLCLSYSMKIAGDDGDNACGSKENPCGYIKTTKDFLDEYINVQYVKMNQNQSLENTRIPLLIRLPLFDLDLNGFTLNGLMLITNPMDCDVAFNLKDSTANINYDNNEITYKAGVIDFEKIYSWIDSASNYNAKIIINSGVIKSEILINNYVENKMASIEINGGLVYSKDEIPFINHSSQDGEITINDGIIASNNTTNLITSNGKMPTITINGGIFTANPSEYMASTSKIMPYKMKVIGGSDNNSFTTSVNYIVIPDNNDKEVYVYKNSIAIKSKNVLKVINADEEFDDTKKLADVFNDEYKQQLLNSFTDKEALDIIPMYVQFEDDNAIATIDDDLNDDTYSLSLYLNKETLAKIGSNKYALYQIDDDVNVLVDNETINKNHIDFETNKLGMYALVVYKEVSPTPEVTPTPAIVENKDSSTTKVVTCKEAMGSKDWIWSESKKACVYKVSNTSGK